MGGPSLPLAPPYALPTHPPTHTHAHAGAGSVIIARGSSAPAANQPSVPQDLQATKGGSYIIGRKHSGEWEPGENIERPLPFDGAAEYVIALPGGRGLLLSYSAMSEQGRAPRPPNKANQDSYTCVAGLGNNPNVVRRQRRRARPRAYGGVPARPPARHHRAPLLAGGAGAVWSV